MRLGEHIEALPLGDDGQLPTVTARRLGVRLGDEDGVVLIEYPVDIPDDGLEDGEDDDDHDDVAADQRPGERGAGGGEREQQGEQQQHEPHVQMDGVAEQTLRRVVEPAARQRRPQPLPKDLGQMRPHRHASRRSSYFPSLSLSLSFQLLLDSLLFGGSVKLARIILAGRYTIQIHFYFTKCEQNRANNEHEADILIVHTLSSLR